MADHDQTDDAPLTQERKTCRWRGVATPSVEILHWTVYPGIQLSPTVRFPDEQLDYHITLETNWAFRSLRLRTRSGDRLDLDRDITGAWRADGQIRDDLTGAVDIDLSFSPATNTLPIRRLRLGFGESTQISTAYVDFPSLRVSADRQRYTQLTETRYRHESLDSTFQREITVDADGFIVVVHPRQPNPTPLNSGSRDVHPIGSNPARSTVALSSAERAKTRCSRSAI